MARQTRGGKAPPKQGRAQYSEEVKTACLCALLAGESVPQAAKRYGVAESTLRAWRAKGETGADGWWMRAREEQMRRTALRAAEGARLSAELLCRRLEAGARNLARCEEIDRLLLECAQSAENAESERLAAADGTEEDAARARLAAEREKRLCSERKMCAEAIPSDAALSTMLRALASVSEKSAGALGASEQAAQARGEDPFEEIEGEEW